jgi:beta-lactam-binding protein with PASTA domain
MRFTLTIICCLFCLAALPGYAVLQKQGAGLSRPSQYYKSLPIEPNPALCKEACDKDPRCKAYTYVKPGVNGRQALCLLSSEVLPVVNNGRYISGVKGEIAQITGTIIVLKLPEIRSVWPVEPDGSPFVKTGGAIVITGKNFSPDPARNKIIVGRWKANSVSPPPQGDLLAEIGVTKAGADRLEGIVTARLISGKYLLWVVVDRLYSKPVTVWFAPDTVLLPDFVGQAIDQVRQRYGARPAREATRRPQWFTFDSEDDYSCDREPGAVAKQSPQAGSSVEIGARVKLWVAACVIVPSVVEKSVGEAQRILGAKKLGFDATQEPTNTARVDTVLKQSPAPGARVPPGTVVHLTIATLPRVQVPDVMNRTLEEAKTLLKDQGLKAVTLEQVSRKPLIVTDQDPKPGAWVIFASEVRLTVSPPPVLMPDLVGQPLEEAKRSPDFATFRATIAIENDPESQFQPGIVSRQEPLPGTIMQAQMTVKLWVASPPPAIVMPDLVGRRMDVVKDDPGVLRLGLKIQEENDDSSDLEPGVITKQSPQAGTNIAVGERVNLWVAGSKTPPTGTGGTTKPQRTDDKIPPWLIGLLAAGTGYFIFRIARKLVSKQTPKAPSPELCVRPVMGTPEEHIWTEGRLVLDGELRLRAKPDRGMQSIEGLGTLLIEEGR